MKKYIWLILSLMIVWGCAIFSQSYIRGTQAEMAKNYDEAIEYYERALLQDPNNSVYRLALLRAQIGARNSHLYKARQLAAQENKEKALEEYQKALSYDPENRMILEEARRLSQQEIQKEKPAEEKMKPPLKLDVSDEEITLKFIEEADLRSIFKALGKHADINILFDSQFRDMSLAIDLQNMSFLQALNTLCLSSQNFFRVVDENTVLIVPDTPQNREKYDVVALKTFYLSNIEAKNIQSSLMQMLRRLSQVPKISIDETLNSITIKDTPDVLETAEKLIKLWDKPRGEVMIDLEIMEVSRKKMRNIGLSLDSYAVSGMYSASGEEESTGWNNVNEIDFSKAENYQISLPIGTLRFLESDADTKIIAQPRLRGIEGEKIEYIVGDEVPIPRTTFSPIAAGGVSQQPITSFEYKNVGIEIYITPEIHFEKEITLEMEVKIKALGGSGYGDLPIITTREVKNIIRLREGETNLLAGLLKDEERKTLKGIAGLKSIPLIGNLFSNTDQEIQQTDVVMTLTPYIIRSIPLDDEDYKPIWMNLEKGFSSGLSIDSTPERELSQELERGQSQAPQAKEPSLGANSISISPPEYRGTKGRDIQVRINLASEKEVQNMSLNISFDPNILELKEVRKGNIIQGLGENPSFLESTDNDSGTCTIGFSSSDVASGFKGSGNLVTLIFVPVAAGEGSISISEYSSRSPTGESLTFSTTKSRIIIR
ncbi:MAG TPA: secretin N-terminal domain-containing protein [Acidobacteriota bacterium]|nr:secretin N-terminal domain-containing protein [Acidobacteriota bacterium]